jgi:hypothetical protein
LTARIRCRILIRMARIALLLTVVGVVAGVALVQPSKASAGWCWPDCSDYGFLTWSTSTNNGCWYRSGAVCSGWSYWSVNGVSKTCYPDCNVSGYTTGQILYGFENSERIRGRFTVASGKFYVSPSGLGMGGYLRAHVTWWSGVSQINAAVIG